MITRINPFEKLSKFTHKNYKIVAVLALMTTIIAIPLVLHISPDSSTTGFLSQNTPSVIASNLLDKEFPNRSSVSMIIVLHSNNSTVPMDSSQALQTISNISSQLLTDPSLTNQINISSLASVERASLNSISNNFNSSFKDSFTQIANNITLLQSSYKNVSQLARTIQDLAIYPLQYSNLWSAIARTVFYLAKNTTAYNNNSVDITPFQTINSSSIWYTNASMGIPPQNITISIAAYNATNTPYPSPYNKTGIFMVQNIINVDSIVNNIVFNMMNSSIYEQWALANPSQSLNTTAYTQSLEYTLINRLNTAWNNSINTYASIHNDLTGLFEQLYSGSNISLVYGSQINLFSQLLTVANSTYLNFVPAVIQSLLSSSSSSSNTGTSIPSLPPNAPFPSNSTITQLTNQSLSNLIPSNARNAINLTLAVYYRNSITGIPSQELENTILSYLNNQINSGSQSGNKYSSLSVIDLIFTSTTVINELNSATNMTLVLNQIYNVTQGNSTLSIENIATQTSQRIANVISSLVPLPLPSNIRNAIRETYISSDNTTTLIFITFPKYNATSGNEQILYPYVNIVRNDLINFFSNNNLSQKYQYWVTGQLAISYDTDKSLNGDIEGVDRITVTLVLGLLLIVYLSLIAPFVPLAGIGLAILSALGAIFLISNLLNMAIPSLMISILTVVMMGAGIDYCLFITWRYKEERQRGRNQYSAVREAMIHAGESVASSGTTVMIGFGSLLLSSFSLLNEMGLGPMIGIGFSLVAALTFIPIGLFLFGDLLYWPHKYNKSFQKTKAKYIQEKANANNNANNLSLNNTTNRNNNNKRKKTFFRRTAEFTVKHPWPIIVFFLVFASFFLVNALEITPSYDSTDFLPRNVQSVTGLQHLQNGGFSLGRIFPIEVVLNFTQPLSNSPTDPFFNLTKLQQIENFARDFMYYFGTKTVLVNGVSTPLIAEIDTVTQPFGSPVNLSQKIEPDIKQSMLSYVGSKSNTTVLFNVLISPSIQPIGTDGLQLVNNINTWSKNYLNTHGLQGFGKNNVNILVTGSPAEFNDISQIVGRESPYLAAAVLIGIYIVLFILTGSVFTPLRLELTILLSIVVALGSMQIYFVDILHEGIPWMVPIMLFVLIFGLGMDYDIFIVTRMREEVSHRGVDDDEAIVTALEKNGAIITAAGSIMAAALGSLFLASSNILKIMGFAFFVAILLDATLVRQLLVPAIMVVAKDINWWNPIKQLQRVPPKEERARLRALHSERIESDLILNDLSDEEVHSYQKLFKTDAKHIEELRRDTVKIMQQFWRLNEFNLRRLPAHLEIIKLQLDQIKKTYEGYASEVKDALDIYLEANEADIAVVEEYLIKIEIALGLRQPIKDFSYYSKNVLSKI